MRSQRIGAVQSATEQIVDVPAPLVVEKLVERVGGVDQKFHEQGFRFFFCPDSLRPVEHGFVKFCAACVVYDEV